MNKKETGYLLGAALLILTLVACGGSDSSSTVDTDTTSASDTDNTQSDTQLGLDPDNFLTDALAQDISTTSCTLSDGTETQCYEIVINGVPSNNEIGPFCPTHIDDDETQGGVWFDGAASCINSMVSLLCIPKRSTEMIGSYMTRPLVRYM